MCGEFKADPGDRMKTNEHVLDEYGNNAAVRCPSCSRVFIVSKWLNRQRGRLCPGCGKSRALFVRDRVSVTTEGAGGKTIP
jgi:ribosomal protein S27E